MNLRDVRESLAAALTGSGFRPYDTLPADGELPLAAVSWPDEIRYTTTMGDGVEIEITVTIAVSLNDFDQAQRELDAAMSVPGLATELQKYPTAAWHSLLVESSGVVRQLDVGSQALAADFTLTIYA